MVTVPRHPQEVPGISRRDLLFGGGGALTGVGLARALDILSQSSMQETLFVPPAEIDPFWTDGIWKDTTDQLRTPEKGEAGKSPRGRIESGLLPIVYADNPPRQNIELYHFSETDRRFTLPSQLEPEAASGPLCFSSELLYFNPSSAQFQNKEKVGTFRMDIGNALNPTASPFGLFMTGMNVFHLPGQGAALNQTLFGAGAPVIIPEGVAQLRFNFWRTKPDSWWSKIFGFGKKVLAALPTLFPSIIIPSAVKPVLEFVNSMIGNSEAVDKDKFDYLWKSGGNSLAVTKQAKQNHALSYSLRSGLWVVVDKSATELDLDSNLLINPARFFLARRSEPDKPVLLDANYLVWRCQLIPAKLATGDSCTYQPLP